MLSRLISYIEHKKSILNSFVQCKAFMCNGEYVFDNSLTYIYICNDAISSKASAILDSNYTKLMLKRSFFWRAITFLIKKFMLKEPFVNYRNNEKEQLFHGNLYLPGTGGLENKIFDLKNNKVLLLYSDRQAYSSKLINYNYFKEYFPIPGILMQNDSSCFIIESFIDFKRNYQWSRYDYLRVYQDILSKQIAYLEVCEKNGEIYYKSSNDLLTNTNSLLRSVNKDSPIVNFIMSKIKQDILDNEFPFLKLHGDLWTSNILIENNNEQNIYYIDWDSSNIFVFFYDLFFIILNECVINNNFIYLEKYMLGEFDYLLRKAFKVFNINFEPNIRIDYLYITLLNQYINRWTTEGNNVEIKILKQWKSVFNKCEWLAMSIQ